MSMSTQVVGFKPVDETWEKMKAVWDACMCANIDPPEDVHSFFENEEPDEAGVSVEIEGHACCTEYNAEMQDGFEIDLTAVPPGVKLLRFYNSY